MLEFLSNINPLILDVVVISIFVLIIFFGIIKGFKKTVISFVLFAVAVFLGFSPYSNSLKKVFIDKVFVVENMVSSGSNDSIIFFVSLFVNCMSSIALFLLFYIVLNLIKILFGILLKRKTEEKNKRKSVAGRVIGGFISLAYCGFVTLVLLFALNTNMIGMKTSVSKSTVTKFITEKSEILIDKIDPKLKEKVVIKIFVGDLLFKVDDKLILSFDLVEKNAGKLIRKENYFEKLSSSSLKKEEAVELVKEGIIMVDNLAIISDKFDYNNENLKEDFSNFAEELLTVLNKTIKSNGADKIEFNMNDYGKIVNDLKNAGVKDNILKLLNEIIEQK